MEITDDKLVDNRVNPSDNYWEDDLTEFFIDEDHTPQGHECVTDAYKAFAYHISAVSGDKNNYSNGSKMSFDSPDGINHVIDLGTDCNTNKVMNFDEHVNVKITKNGNKYTWELEFKIFNKNYNQNSLTNTPVTLTANKVMGFAIAYCDDDNGTRENMIDIDFKIFPNPLEKGSLSIELPEGTEQLSIFDVTGKMVYKIQTVENFYNIDQSIFKSKGIYIINLKTGNN